MLCRLSNRSLKTVVLATLLAPTVLACTPARETPLLTSQEFGTPTPVPRPTTTRSPAEAVEIAGRRISDAQTALDVQGKDVIRVANWRDAGVAMHNNLMGYLMVWGYGYTVELVEMEHNEYRAAIENGEVDLVLQVDTADPDAATWLGRAVESGAVIDGGRPFSDRRTVRIAVHHSMSTRAPELVELLGTVTMTGSAFSEIARTVKFGRVGVTPNAGAVKYLKEQGAVWTTWVSADVAAKVEGAIEAGKTSLRNRTCIPRGVEANDCGRN